MIDDFETEKHPHIGALDTETPIFRTGQSQTLKSEAKRALQIDDT